jgi:alkanesulfonate monooxygenase SsuD/methylene tetrahydromethanopterin reductase-like flavin-dependent oxidoreductase (luciferase family)
MSGNSLPENVRELVNRALVLGDPDTVGERVQREILEPGLDGIGVSLPADAHVEGAVERATTTLRKAIG